MVDTGDTEGVEIGGLTRDFSASSSNVLRPGGVDRATSSSANVLRPGGVDLAHNSLNPNAQLATQPQGQEHAQDTETNAKETEEAKKKRFDAEFTSLEDPHLR